MPHRAALPRCFLPAFAGRKALGRLSAFLLLVFLAACDSAIGSKDRTMPDLPDVKANLAFTCAYEKERIPPRDREAEQLYQHAKWLKKNNLLKPDPLVYPKIERLVRIATAYGHDKANLELRDMLGEGTAHSQDIVKETLDLTDDLIKRGIPGGYFDMGIYLERGYGMKQDKDLALKYYRKSADMGSPDGQYVVAELLAPIDNAPEIALQMWRCAAEQGHGKAGLELGSWLKGDKVFPESLQAFQLGAKAGNPTAALSLQDGFNDPKPTDEVNYLGQQTDLERVHRYKAVFDLLADYSYLNPKVPEIDAIVPLPPAKLPPWDGTFKWLKDHQANVPPPLPTEERIREMATAKNLDPETGRPIKQKKAEAAAPVKAIAVATIPLGTVLASGTRCPQSGLWQCAAPNALGGDRRSFTAGETLPTVLIPASRSLIQKLKGDPQNQLAETTWTLIAVPEPVQGAGSITLG